MPAFLIPLLCIFSISTILLLPSKAFLKEALPSIRSLALFNLAFLVQCICLYAGILISKNGSHHTLWTAKAFSLIGLALFIAICRDKLTLRDIGICAPNPRRIGTTVLLFVVLGAITWSAIQSSHHQQEFSMNMLLFMLTASGTDEELVFRGLMPALLINQVATGRQRKINKAIALLIPSLIFTSIHALRFSNGHFSFSPSTFAMISIGACVFMYLRQITGSLLGPLVVHNLVNAGTMLMLAKG